MWFRQDSVGRIGALAGPPAAGSPFNNGVAFHPDGRAYTTTVPDVTDRFIGGVRVSNLGELVTIAAGAAIDYNAGLTQSGVGTAAGSEGALVSQVDQALVAADPYINGGVRVSAAGITNLTASSPP